MFVDGNTQYFNSLEIFYYGKFKNIQNIQNHITNPHVFIT